MERITLGDNQKDLFVNIDSWDNLNNSSRDILQNVCLVENAMNEFDLLDSDIQEKFTNIKTKSCFPQITEFVIGLMGNSKYIQNGRLELYSDQFHELRDILLKKTKTKGEHLAGDVRILCDKIDKFFIELDELSKVHNSACDNI